MTRNVTRHTHNTKKGWFITFAFAPAEPLLSPVGDAHFRINYHREGHESSFSSRPPPPTHLPRVLPNEHQEALERAPTEKTSRQPPTINPPSWESTTTAMNQRVERQALLAQTLGACSPQKFSTIPCEQIACKSPGSENRRGYCTCLIGMDKYHTGWR